MTIQQRRDGIITATDGLRATRAGHVCELHSRSHKIGRKVGKNRGTVRENRVFGIARSPRLDNNGAYRYKNDSIRRAAIMNTVLCAYGASKMDVTARSVTLVGDATDIRCREPTPNSVLRVVRLSGR